MRSSTSSFETYQLTRIIPRHPWGRMAALSATFALFLTIGWEMACRHRGYHPTLDDNADLWASQRARLEREPHQTTVIGSSRILFDLDLRVYEDACGERPIQLATVGTNPGPYLEHLAQHPTYHGTVIVGVVPGLFFAPKGPPIENAEKNLRHYNAWGPAKRIGFHLGAALQDHLALIQQEDLSLPQLMGALPIKNRPYAQVRPPLPPYFARMDRQRQARMIDQDTPWARRKLDRVRDGWIPLFTPPPFPPNMTKEQIRAAIEGFATERLEKTKAYVQQIQEKGGRVVFVRCPSSGELRALEQKLAPKERYWDRLIAMTGCPGIHFEEHASLQHFVCAEWSHLTAHDATRFTQALIPLLQACLQK